MHIAYGPLWSLAVEEQFYLLWPLVIFWIRPRAAMILCGLLLTGSAAVRIALTRAGLEHYAYRFTPMHLDGLAIGSLIALTYRSNSARLRNAQVPFLIASTVALIALVVWRNGIDFYDTMSRALGILALSLFSGAILIAAIYGAAPKFLAHDPLRSIGKYSYAMYLFHWPLLLLVRRAGVAGSQSAPAATLLNLLMVFALATLLSFAAALISWHLIEKRFLALKRFFPGPSPLRTTQHRTT